jgi:hypothetical protein
LLIHMMKLLLLIMKTNNCKILYIHVDLYIISAYYTQLLIQFVAT